MVRVQPRAPFYLQLAHFGGVILCMGGGSWARNKGLGFERKVAEWLRCVFPLAKRHLEFQTSEANGYDLDNTGRYYIQCKKYKNYVPVGTITEVKCDRALGDIPVLITAGDNKPAVAVIYFEDFLELLKATEPKPEPLPPKPVKAEDDPASYV